MKVALVDTDKEGYKSVNYGALIAPLIESVKELVAMFSTHDQEIKKLKADNEAMRAVLCEIRPEATFCAK